MLPTLKALQPKVFREVLRQADAMSQLASPAPLAGAVVVTSDNGQVKLSRFLGSGTWKKTSNNSFVIVFAWNGGCGGGSGRRATTGGASSDAQGGAGGAPGNAMMLMLPSYYFGTTTTITVGAGGAGGASISSAATNGLPGSTGGTTSIGSITIPQTGTGGNGGGTATQPAGGTGGMNTYVMGGGYTIPSGQQTGASASSTSQATGPYIPDSTTIGSGTVRMPCLPFMVATGGGGGMPIATNLTTPSNGGDVNLFGSAITMGGLGVALATVGTAFDKAHANNGTYLSYPYGGILNNNQAMMFVTGGTGGGAAGQGGQTGVTNQGGGNGGIGAGGGGGSGATGNGAASSSGAGGNGGPGLVLIYEFI